MTASPSHSRLTAPLGLVDLLLARAELHGEALLYRYLATGEVDGPAELLSYAELDRRARAVAARLQEAQARGERALLLYPPGLDFVVGFFGCLYAGVIAVPAYPPDPTRLQRTLPRLRAIARDAGAALVLTVGSIRELARSLAEQAPELAALQWVATDELPAELGARWRCPPQSGEDVAFLQYTSGSTGEPKGVMVRHDNLLHNSMLIRTGFEHDHQSSGVGWLPMFHDMGLIGNVLQPLYVGFPCTLMSPLAFLQRPLRWLEAVARFRATTSGGPNFAYDLCARKASPAAIAALDLRSWTLAFTGAEPVRNETLERFAEVFAPTGFRPAAFYPCYGLAEATLLVTGASKTMPPCRLEIDASALEQGQVETARPPRATPRVLVSSGRPGDAVGVVIVAPETGQRCIGGQIGEIWVTGPSVAGGYWNRPAETEAVFDACLADTREGPFLRTGDLGFVHDGELFVTGRLKDLLIYSGRNYYPQDIERTVEQAHASVRVGCSAAFSVEVAGEERLAVVCEVELRGGIAPEAVIRAVRQAILEEHGVYPHAVGLLARGGIPKTSSGKIQRHACREGFATQTLDEVARSIAETELPVAEESASAPRTALEALLVQVFGEVLGIERLGIHDNVFTLGLQSLLATQAVSRLRAALSVEVALQELFEAPTVAALAAEIEASRAGGSRPARPRLTAEPHPPEELPLSFAQQRLLFLEQLEPGGVVYNIPAAVRLQGPLDARALAHSVQEIVRRHETLRTVFAMRDGQPYPRILQAHPWSIPVMTLPELDTSSQAAEVQRQIMQEAHTPFDLARGPLLRTKLLRLSAQEHVFLVTVHHLVADGWSMGVLVRELGVLYASFARGEASPLPALPIQYTDYALWQRRRLAGEGLETQLAYWKKQLDGAPPALNLPTDRPHPPVQTHRGAAVPITLPRELSAALSELARGHGATLYMALLAGFQALLQRYTGQDDIVVGAPIAGRTEAQTEPLIGLFVNTLVLRTDLSGDPTVAELLLRVRETTLGAYAHQELPFEKLVEELAPARDLSRSPLFQVMLILQNTPMPALSLGELQLSLLDVAPTAAKFELTLSLEETAAGLSGTLEYNSDLFDAATIARMADHYQVLLYGLVADPAGRISQLPLLTAAERHTLLVAWNATSAEAPGDCSIHQLFEAQVERTPAAVAVVFEDQSLTYRALNARANQLAHHLRSLGVGPEVLTGLCVERSLEMVVGLLAILKAGGAYVPLDPTYPRERLDLMMEDAGVQILLTQARVGLPAPAHLSHRVCLDTVWETIAAAPKDNPPHAAGADPLAYVIYTSGSTGTPKGVAIPHRAVVNFLAAMRVQPGLHAADRLLSVTSLSFDIAALELFLPLSVGACVEVASRAVVADGRALAERLTRSEITVLQATPTTFHLLLAAGWQGSPRLKILVGGEAVSRELVNQLAARAASVWNMYGPTETTIWSCVCPLDSGAGPVPIGRPIANTTVYVLDARLQPVPVGVAGELYIGGMGVARGYLNRPALTAERFVRDPFADSPGARLYRTGDLCRWRADGTLEFLGRTDHQVKLRGFRIELGEIESVLVQHPAIREAVVVAREDRPGDKRLVAYLTAREASLPPPSELRNHLQQRLPEYMVPAAFVALPALPLTPNGKIDRHALPAPPQSGPEPGAAPVAPRTPVEAELAAIWAEVLGVAGVQVFDNFFSLGGHSLLATQVLSRLRPVFGVDVPLRTLFEAPTIAALAVAIEALQTAGGRDTGPLLAAGQRPAGELPLSFAQQRLLFLDQLDPGSGLYNIPVAVRLVGALDQGALASSVQEIVRRHETLRTTFQVIDGRPRQRIAPAAAWSVPLVALQDLEQAAQAAEVRRLVDQEAHAPFDLARGPLLRTKLLRLSAREHVLLATVHHIVADGWSMGVLVRELGALYAAFARGEASPLPELPIQYADYALWQRKRLAGEGLATLLAYWKQQLGGAPPALDLPTDRPRPPVQTYRGAAAPIALSRELSAALSELARSHEVTLYMALVAGFQALLQRYTGQDDIVVGSPIAGRTETQTEALIGLFVNTLVLRTDLSGDPTVAELLVRVRETTLGAYTHQELPFEKLVEELAPARDLSRSPLFQVMLILQNTPLPALSLGGLQLSLLDVAPTAAKFELTVSLSETEEGLQGTVEYNPDLFDAETIARLVGHYQVLLRGLVVAPERRISQLPLLTQGERQRMLLTWNATSILYPRCAGIHPLFQAQAERTPAAVAVVYGAEQLTYRELAIRVERLADVLRSLGVGPDARVGICIERSLDMVVGLLAILSAGGAYVPLDPEYPSDRLSFMLEDSQAVVLLTQTRLNAGRSLPGVPLLCVDDSAAWPDLQGRAGPRPAAAPLDEDHLAYVMYTSGSTGRPKGVAVSHRNLHNLLATMQYQIELGAADRVLAVTSISFDISTVELFLPLLHGAAIVLCSSAMARDAYALAAEIHARRVTVLQSTPSRWKMLVAAGYRPEPGCRVLAGGEPLERALATTLGERGASVINGYGPTEATVYSIVWPVPALPDPLRPNDMRIGTPLPNYRAYVLDPWLEPVPIGVSGELYLGGDFGLARGYLNRPGLTAERFMADPFAPSSPGARMYRTGDLVRWRHDGTLEFLGRIDHQVKLRGFRIELGEIEATLVQHPAIREAVVMVREDTSGSPFLCAYLVARSEPPPASALREFLQRTLPDHMLPSRMMILDALPYTASGKLARNALPSPDGAHAMRAALRVAPRSETEQALARIFGQVLEQGEVSIHDDFFSLGGHSLRAMQLANQLRSHFRLDIPLRVIFERPTIEQLAAWIDQAQALALADPSAPSHAPELVRREGPGPHSLSFAQERLWYLERASPQAALYNLSMSVRIRGPLSVAVLTQSIRAIMRRHHVLRASFHEIEGQLQQDIAEDPPFEIAIVDLGTVPGPELPATLSQLQENAARHAFDLGRPPLFRVILFRIADNAHVFMLTMHHIISDGWSLGVVLHELSAIYPAIVRDEPSPLAALPVQYTDYAAWQRRWLTDETLKPHLRYWLHQLHEAPGPLQIPHDWPRSGARQAQGRRAGTQLSPELSGALKQMSHGQGTTLFMTLFAVYAMLLHRLTGHSDIVVGIPANIRPRAEVDRLIGLFLNNLVLRVDVASDQTFRGLLQQVRRVTLDAYEHRHLPFDKLLHELKRIRPTEKMPLYRLFFNMLDFPEGKLELPDLTVDEFASPGAPSKMDVSFYLMDRAEGIMLEMVYDAAILAEERIATMLRQFCSLLGQVLERPDDPVGAYAM